MQLVTKYYVGLYLDLDLMNYLTTYFRTYKNTISALETRGQFHKLFCALRQSYVPYAKLLHCKKASQKSNLEPTRSALGANQFKQSVPSSL